MPLTLEQLSDPNQILQAFNALETEIEKLKQVKPQPAQDSPGQSPVAASQHPAGLCANPGECDICQKAMEPYLVAAYQKGIDDNGNAIDQALTDFRGKAFRDEVAGYVEAGQKLRQSTLTVADG